MRAQARSSIHRACAGLALGLAVWVSACSLNQWDILESDWKLDAINSMTTPMDPPLVCGLPAATDSTVANREACEFTSGAKATDTLGVPASFSAMTPVRHVIIVMKENRTFDHLLGQLSVEGQSATEPIPERFDNVDLQGKLVTPFREDRSCIEQDADHQWNAMHAGVASGSMSGFVTSAANTTGTDGHFVMSYYDDKTLPFYYWLANTFALSDRHFSPTPSGTYANRNFLLFGSNAGIIDTGLKFPSPRTPSIFRELMKQGKTWGVYTDGSPFSGALDWDGADPGVHSFGKLIDALDAGTLPNVAFVDGRDSVDDDHPPADLQVGEAWLRTIYEHAIKSPEWPRLAIIWTYDEGGGFADHVPPQAGCPASPTESAFFERGPRVPLVVISPWAKRHYVSHVVHDHTAITRFIEATFDLPALTGRDANSDALLDLFDFSCASALKPPPAGPPSGKGACTQ